MLCWQSEILINKHKHNKVYCINIKIEDHILKYKEYPKQYQSWYQLGDFQSHPISKDQTSARNKTSIKIIYRVCFSSVTPSPQRNTTEYSENKVLHLHRSTLSGSSVYRTEKKKLPSLCLAPPLYLQTSKFYKVEIELKDETPSLLRSPLSESNYLCLNRQKTS